jgi:hypothetical protein
MLSPCVGGIGDGPQNYGVNGLVNIFGVTSQVIGLDGGGAVNHAIG